MCPRASKRLPSGSKRPADRAVNSTGTPQESTLGVPDSIFGASHHPQNESTTLNCLTQTVKSWCLRFVGVPREHLKAPVEPNLPVLRGPFCKAILYVNLSSTAKEMSNWQHYGVPKPYLNE